MHVDCISFEVCFIFLASLLIIYFSFHPLHYFYLIVVKSFVTTIQIYKAYIYLELEIGIFDKGKAKSHFLICVKNDFRSHFVPSSSQTFCKSYECRIKASKKVNDSYKSPLLPWILFTFSLKKSEENNRLAINKITFESACNCS